MILEVLELKTIHVLSSRINNVISQVLRETDPYYASLTIVKYELTAVWKLLIYIINTIRRREKRLFSNKFAFSTRVNPEN